LLHLSDYLAVLLTHGINLLIFFKGDLCKILARLLLDPFHFGEEVCLLSKNFLVFLFFGISDLLVAFFFLKCKF
jgi:hypothetical protein